jgi:sterol desaturase/sphingolipid hydroxylase (fatty acid hydroxylase superfamily)
VTLYLFHTRNTAYFYVAMATFYFMSYEVLHFCYHLDDDMWISHLPVIRALRRHHRIHHRLNLMLKYNFNITWPIADFFFGTIYRERTTEPPPEPAADERESLSMAGK